MSEEVNYAELLKCAEHLTGKQQKALGDLAHYFGLVMCFYQLTRDETRAILETMLDTQAAIEAQLPEEGIPK